MSKPKMILIEWLPTNTTEGYDEIIEDRLIYDYIAIKDDTIEVFLFQTENDYILWKLKYSQYENDVFRILKS